MVRSTYGYSNMRMGCYNIQMRSSVLASSRFGKFYPRCEDNLQTVELSACGPLEQMQFTITGERLYLLDSQGALTSLTLADCSLSTFTGVKLAHF